MLIRHDHFRPVPSLTVGNIVRVQSQSVDITACIVGVTRSGMRLERVAVDLEPFYTDSWEIDRWGDGNYRTVTSLRVEVCDDGLSPVSSDDAMSIEEWL